MNIEFITELTEETLDRIKIVPSERFIYKISGGKQIIKKESTDTVPTLYYRVDDLATDPATVTVFCTNKDINTFQSLEEGGGTGNLGPQGPQGDQGAEGPQGAVGPQGAQGEKGDQGEQGPQGPQGIAGTDGNEGPQGVAGNDGSQGEQGPQGTQGAQGAQGPQGFQGAQGTQVVNGMFYPGIKVDTQKLFALTKSSTEDDIKAALQLETASGGYTLPTEEILNDCLGKGYQLLSNWMPVNVAWNGAAWVFYIVGQTYMNQPNAVAMVSIKITDGVYSVFQAAKITELVSKDDIKLIPIQVDVPIGTGLSNKIYTEEEILGFFGVTTVSELKQLIVSGAMMYARYGITLSTLPKYYRMPIQYVAFESATQIKLVFIGLDTSNDAPSKYEVLMNLDGTVIENECNINVTITAI